MVFIFQVSKIARQGLGLGFSVYDLFNFFLLLFFFFRVNCFFSVFFLVFILFICDNFFFYCFVI